MDFSFQVQLEVMPFLLLPQPVLQLFVIPPPFVSLCQLFLHCWVLIYLLYLFLVPASTLTESFSVWLTLSLLFS